MKKNKSIAIIQARMSSKRLPGKVLMPVEKIPIILLAVKRAANTGRKVIVATSKHKSDDKLVELLIRENINYLRGSLKNVLSRYASIVKNLNSNQLIFRLTADNVFPDGLLLDEMEKFFYRKKINYLSCGKGSGLPFGLNAELTRVKYIREANIKSKSSYDKEHVTPFIKKKYKVSIFNKYKHLNMEEFRCTIDYIQDYKIIKKTFKKLGNKSINILFKKLLLRLKKNYKFL